MESNSWIEKYKPNRSDEIVCNYTAMNKMKTWIKNWPMLMKKSQDMKKTTKKNASQRYKKKIGDSCMIVTGNHGIGKTMTTEVILREFGYNVKILDFESVKTNNGIVDYIKKYVQSLDIMNMMCDSDGKKTAIIIDEIESITSSNEKKYILTLQKYNDIEWFCPIILISNNQHNKMLSDIKKNSFQVRMYPPEKNDMIRILRQIVSKEELNIKNSHVINKIIDHSQNDIRRLIFTLQDIEYTYGSRLISVSLIEEYCDISKKKDIDTDLYTSTEVLLFKFKNIDECLRHYETEKVLLPLMVHENYIESVLTNFMDEQEQFDIINEVSELLSTGDVIENYIYGDQSWIMQENHGYYTCAATSFAMCNSREGEELNPGLEFASDLNKTSIKKINKKNISNTNECFKGMNIFDYMYINQILIKLINSGRIDEFIDLVRNYDIKLEHIESLLKIDKIKSVKVSLTSKQKRDIRNELIYIHLEKDIVKLLNENMIPECAELIIDNNIESSRIDKLIRNDYIVLTNGQITDLMECIRKIKNDKIITKFWIDGNVKKCGDFCTINNFDIDYVKNVIVKNVDIESVRKFEKDLVHLSKYIKL